MKMNNKLLLIISFCLPFIACEKKTRMVDIKLLILTPKTYYNIPVILNGKIFEVGPGGLWFVLEDKTGYIQVTTENISTYLPCMQRGKEVAIIGKLIQFKEQKYFSYMSMLRCSN